MVKMVPVCIAVMVSFGNAPPLGRDDPPADLHPEQVEELLDRLADILAQRGSGAFALLGKWHAAGDGADPDLFVVDMGGRVLFGVPRDVAEACGERFLEECRDVAGRYGSGWIDGSAPAGGGWSYVRETRVDDREALIGARVRVNRDGTVSTASVSR